MEINIVTFTDFVTLLLTLFKSPLAKSLDIPGIKAVAMAEANAIGILAILVPFAMALRSVATADSSTCLIPIMICW